MTNYGILPFPVLSQSEDEEKGFRWPGVHKNSRNLLGGLACFLFTCDIVFTTTGTVRMGPTMPRLLKQE